jgi:Glutaredoxin and related proteins
MKKTVISFAVMAALVAVVTLNWGSVHGLLVSRPNFAALHAEPVILYGTDWCSNCKMTRAYLRKNDIAFF